MGNLDRYNEKAQPIRDAINARPLTDFYPLERSKGGLYNCPICGSGTGPNKTGSLSIRKTDNRVTCFAGNCFRSEDTLGALRKLYAEKTEQEIFSLCGYSLDGAEIRRAGGTEKQTRKEGKNMEAKQDQGQSFKADIERYAAALPGSEGESYLTGRGFTRETMQRFRLGYDAERHCVTIPYNRQGSYYGRRSTTQDAGRKHNNLTGVKVPLFNTGALYESDVCFVVESPLCAISIAQEGGAAVATSGTNHTGLVVEQLKKKPTAAAIVLCFDNDEPGRKAAAELGAELEKLGVFCGDATAAIMGETKDPDAGGFCKDPNEVLQRKGPDALREAIADVIDETRRQRGMAEQEAEEERQQRTGVEMVDAFLAAIQTRRYEPMPTGIEDIDNAIGGGFMRQQLVLLGAAPGVGKTALTQWIFEGMATRGTACVYLNLEMSRDQILARSISRISKRRGYEINATKILQGYNWTPEQRAAVLEAAEEYTTTIAPRMAYNPDGVTANLDSVLVYIEAEAQRAEKAGRIAPCVVLDYMQILSGEPREDAASLIKRAVSGFKSYAVKHNTLVFVIIAHNRDSNSKGTVSMESGRDTSALEYSADLQLALTYTACLKNNGKEGKKPEDLTEDELKKVSLIITKGRFGGARRRVDLEFNGGSMTYTILPKGQRQRKTL